MRVILEYQGIEYNLTLGRFITIEILKTQAERKFGTEITEIYLNEMKCDDFRKTLEELRVEDYDKFLLYSKTSLTNYSEKILVPINVVFDGISIILGVKMHFPCYFIHQEISRIFNVRKRDIVSFVGDREINLSKNFTENKIDRKTIIKIFEIKNKNI